MLISGLAVVVGGILYVVPARNPLLTADKEQLSQWYPSYCGGDMYNSFPPKAYLVNMCVDGIILRVAMATGVKLTRAEVLDPRVEAHFREVVGAK